MTGAPQVVPAQTIGASYGDALLAARGVGLVGTETRWDEAHEVLEPDPSLRAVYDDLYGVYRRLYVTTRDEVHDLSRMQEQAAEARLG